MANKSSITTTDNQSVLLKIFGLVVLLSIFFGVYTEMYFLFGIPAFLLVVYLCIVDFSKIFYCLIACIPFSIEIALPGGFGTDLPTEPLMVGLMLVYLVFAISQGKKMNAGYLLHPISLLLLLHVGWIFATAITSSNLLVSVKFALAKVWYVIVFYFMAGSLLKKEKDIRTYIWCLLIPLLITIIYALIRHAQVDFSFDRANHVLSPFYRNHVNYAALLALFVPMVWYLRKSFKIYTLNWWLALSGLIIILVGINFAYTRAAYVAILFAIVACFIIRFRLIKIAIGLSVIVVISGVLYFNINNTYLDYAPNFERTVAHTRFDNLVEATYKGEDISTMERFYRWVAANYMIQEYPWVGFGPGNFYNFYHGFTVSSFETYVSDNPEKSGVHSYFLMTAVEQGLPGLFFFLLLNFYVLIKGENIYHQTHKPFRKQIVMAVLLSIIIIDSLLLINDLIETDKVGSLFFLHMAILVNVDLDNRKEGLILG